MTTITPIPRPIVPKPAAALKADAPVDSAAPPVRMLIDRRPNAWRFPFVSLPRSDERLLFDLSVRLKSKDQVLIQNTLIELGRDVVVDFPSEVFLQRPQILGALLDLLSGLADDPIVDRLVADALVAIATGLRSSLRLYCDPMSRPPPTPLTTLALSDVAGDVDEVQYPPRGQRAASDVDDVARESISLRCNLSVGYFAETVVDAIIDKFASVAKLTVYLPAMLSLIPFCSDDGGAARLDALAAVLRFHIREPPNAAVLHSLLRAALVVVDSAATLTAELGDVLGEVLCGGDDLLVDLDTRSALLKVLARFDHASANIYAEACAVLASMSLLASADAASITVADIDKALAGIPHNDRCLPRIVDVLFEQLPSHPTTLSMSLHRLMLNPLSDVRDYVYGRLRMLLHIDPLPTFLLQDRFLHDVVVVGLGDGSSAAGEFLAEACGMHPRSFVEALRPCRALIDMLATFSSTTAALAMLIRDLLDADDRLAADLRRLFHRDHAVVRESATLLAVRVCEHVAGRWDIHDEELERIVAQVVEPFAFDPNTPLPAPTPLALPFTERDVGNLSQIFSNFSLDVGLRSSAAEQLGRMFSLDREDGRRQDDLFALLDQIIDQLCSCTLDILNPTPPSPILLPTLRLLLEVVVQSVARPTRSLPASGRLLADLLPFVFHGDDTIRLATAEIVAIIVFHHRYVAADVLGLDQPGLVAPGSVRCPIPNAVASLFKLPTTSVVLDPLPPRRSDVAPDVRIARLIERRLRFGDDDDARVRPDTTVRALLEVIESAGSHEALLLAANTLRSCCIGPDSSYAIAMRNLDWRDYLQRFLSVAPACPDDDIALVALLDMLQQAGVEIVHLLCTVALPVCIDRLERSASCDFDLLLSYSLSASHRVALTGVGTDASSFSESLIALLSLARRTEFVASHVFRCLALVADSSSDLLGRCVEQLAQNRLPSSFQRQSLTRSCSTIVVALMGRHPPAPSLFPDPITPSLRWAWRLISDRESAVRSTALRLLYELQRRDDLRDVLLASAVAGTDPNGLALRLAADRSQSPAVRQMAMALLAACEDDEVHVQALVLLPGLLRADVVSPSFWLALLYLTGRLYDSHPDDVLAHLFHHSLSPIFLDLIDTRSLRSRWIAYAERCRYRSAPSPSLVWSSLEHPVAIECGLACLSLLQQALESGRSAIALDTAIIGSALRLLSQIVARPALLHRAEIAIALLLHVDPATLLASLDNTISIDFLNQIARCLSATAGSLRCATCQFLIVVTRTVKPSMIAANEAVVSDVLHVLAELLLSAQARRSYYHDDIACDDSDLHAQALASFAAVLPDDYKRALLADDTLRLLIDQADFLISVYIGREFAAADPTAFQPIVDDIARIVVALKALFFRCPGDVKVYALRQLKLGQVSVKLWRLAANHDRLRCHLLHLCQNLIADCDEAKLIVAGLSRRDKRSSILTGVVNLAVSSSSSLTRTAQQCLQAFAACSDTLPILLRANVVEATARHLRQKRVQSTALMLLACTALTAPGHARVAQVLIPDYIDTVLSCCNGKARTAAFVLLHNLSFYAPTKTALLGNARLLASLLAPLLDPQRSRDDDATVSRLASVALWSLVYDCQKACAIVRQQLLQRRVSLSEMVVTFDDPIRHNLEQVLALIDS